MPRLSSLLLLFVLLSGCATFESGDLPGLDRWPPTANQQQHSLAVTFDGLPKKFAVGWQRGIVRVLEESGRFAHVHASADQAPAVERHLRLEFTHSRSNLWLTRIWMGACGFTAGIIPARTSQQFDVRAVVCDATGGELGVIERSVSGTTWVGWLPLFALPFAGAGLGGLIEGTMRSIIVEGAEAGLL